MPKYLIQIKEIPGSAPYVREPAGTSEVVLDTPPVNHIASFIVDMTNTSRMAQLKTDVDTAVTTAEQA